MSAYDTRSTKEKEAAILQVKSAAESFLDGLGHYRPMHAEFRDDVKRLALLMIALQEAETVRLNNMVDQLKDTVSKAHRGALGAPLGFVTISNASYNADQEEIASLRKALGFERSPGGSWVPRDGDNPNATRLPKTKSSNPTPSVAPPKKTRKKRTP